MDMYRELLGSLGVTVVDIDLGAASPEWIDAVDPEYRRLVMDACVRAAERRDTGRVEFRAKTETGQTRWLSLIVQPPRDGGNGRRLTGALVDVTAERELLDRAARYCAMLANCADAIALLDANARIRFVTGSIERISGYRAAALVGRSAFDTIHPDDLARVREAFRQTLARPGTPVSVEYRARHADGTWRHREVMGVNRLDDPAIESIVVNYRDATARRQAEAALAEHERVYQSIFEEALIGIAHTNRDGRFILVNRRLCDLLGYTLEEFTAMDFAAISHPDEVGQDLDARARLLEGEIDSYSREKRYRRKDGGYVWTNLTVSVHREMSGEPAYFIAVVEDLTQRKLLEQHARQKHKMEAVGRLAGGIAHDFNNLLTAIVGFADLALMRLDDADAVRPDIEEICAAGKSATALTRQLLTFSRQQVLEPRVLGLNAVVSRMRPLLSRLIGEHIDIQWRLAALLDPVFADRGQVEQVVLNLALNARDAMAAGGTLTIETANTDLGGRQVMLAISDTGIGMDDAVKEHLFEPFYTTKDVGKGTGLGLAMVYGIVKQSGGSIRIYSEAGHGTTIKIFLPRAEQTEEVESPPPDVPATLHGTETVLVVEDQREVRSVAAATLRRYGYDVLEAANGADALEAAEARRGIHLLLTDAVMPGMSGRELADRLRRERTAARVLYMSGYSGGVEQQVLIEPGAAFIQKPFAPNALLLKVREVLTTPPRPDPHGDPV